jgi:hypothetical protein
MSTLKLSASAVIIQQAILGVSAYAASQIYFVGYLSRSIHLSLTRSLKLFQHNTEIYFIPAAYYLYPLENYKNNFIAATQQFSINQN